MYSKTALHLILTLLFLEAVAAPPPPLINGKVRVQPDGLVLFKGKALTRVSLPPGPLKLKVNRQTVNSRSILRVEVLGNESRSYTLVAVTSPTPQVIFGGRTGPQGVDGEWSRHVKVDAKGILLFQRRSDVRRCDGAPHYLFPRLFDFSRMTFRPVASLARNGSSPQQLLATRRPTEAPRGEPVGTFRLTFASTRRGDGAEASQLGPPLEAQDHRADTAWFEGVGGDGRGEFLIARSLDTHYALKALRIIPGHAASRQSFQAANRIRSATLFLSPARRYRILFPRDPLLDPGGIEAPYWVILPEPVATRCATLVIDEVYPGSGARHPGGGQTAISELRFLTTLDFSGGLRRATEDLRAQDSGRASAAEAVLLRAGDSALKHLAPRIQLAGKEELRRIIRVLSRGRTLTAAALLVRALPLTKGHLRELVITSLADSGPAAVPLLASLFKGTDTSLAVAAARVLGAIGGPAAQAALLAQVGRGDEELRAAISAGIRHMGPAADIRLFRKAAQEAKEPRRLADLILILGTLGESEPGPTCKLIQALARGSSSFEVKYRALQSVGRLDPRAGQSFLIEAARGTDPDLRSAALAQLSKSPGPAAQKVLFRAISAPQPQVRTAAAQALARFAWDAQVSEALARQLHRERWGTPARALAETLGQHCGAAGYTELRRRARQPWVGVDLLALKSLSRCRMPGLDKFLLRLADDKSVSVTARSRALTLLTPTAARRQAQALFNLFARLRAEAASDDHAEQVAVALIRPLTIMGDPRAARELTDALALDPHPSIRTAAAMALGRLCPPGGAEALRRSLGDVSEAVQRAARDGLARCEKLKRK